MPVIEGSTFWKSEPQEFRISLGGKIAIYYNYRKGYSRLTVIRCMSKEHDDRCRSRLNIPGCSTLLDAVWSAKP